MKVERYKFPPMLGPTSQHPCGSFEYAECLGNELDYRTEKAVKMGVDDLLVTLHKIVGTLPWLDWPRTPCRSIEAYCLACTGYSYTQLYTLVDTFIPDHRLPAPWRITA